MNNLFQIEEFHRLFALHLSDWDIHPFLGDGNYVVSPYKLIHTPPISHIRAPSTGMTTSWERANPRNHSRAKARRKAIALERHSERISHAPRTMELSKARTMESERSWSMVRSPPAPYAWDSMELQNMAERHHLEYHHPPKW